jgi:hypothetical protein
MLDTFGNNPMNASGRDNAAGGRPVKGGAANLGSILLAGKVNDFEARRDAKRR